MKLPPRIESAIDAAGLLIALAVDLVLNIICFAVLAPDMLTKIAFISIGIMIVLFVFRSWAKGFIFAWIIFVSVVFFFDYSFVLEATRTQANSTTVETDGELSRLTAKADAAAAQVLALQAEHAISTRPETLADVKGQIETAQSNVRQYEAERKARIRLIESGNASIKIKSSAIFEAIPNAWSDRRYIPLVVFALVFLGLQLIVTSSIDPEWRIRRANKPDKVKIEVSQSSLEEFLKKDIKDAFNELNTASDFETKTGIEPAAHASADDINSFVDPGVSFQDAIRASYNETKETLENQQVAVYTEDPEPEDLPLAVYPDYHEDVADEHISEFVKHSWYPVRMKHNRFITSKEIFFDLMKRHKKTYNEETYDYLVAQCKRMDIIDIRGMVKIEDESAVVRLLGGTK
jgi:hypothetical protein